MNRFSLLAMMATFIATSSAVAQDAAAGTVAEAAANPASPIGASPTLTWTPDAELFGHYGVSLVEREGGSEWFHSFELSRLHLGVRAAYGDVHARVLLEGTYASDSGSLFGVAGDSFVVRFREAWAGAFFLGRALELRAGIVPTQALAILDTVSQLRPVEQSPFEAAALLSPADVGATLRYELPSQFGHLRLGVYNGDGYTQRELNRGKSIEGSVELHPLAASEALRPLTIFVSYLHGSEGVGSVRANRLVGALLWNASRWRGGVAMLEAWGMPGDGSLRGRSFDVFARVEPMERLLVGARFSHTVRNAGADTDSLSHFTLSVGARVLPGLEAHAAVLRTLLGDEARAALPNIDAWNFRLIVRTALGGVEP